MIAETIIKSIPYICISHCIAIICSVAMLTAVYGRLKKAIYSRYFAIMEIGIIGWMVFKILKTVSPCLELRWSFVVLYYLCIWIFEVSLFLFTYTYYHRKKPPRLVEYMVIFIAVSQFIIVLTNPLHHGYYIYFDFWEDDFGKLVYLHTFLAYLIIFVSFYYGARAFKRELEKYRLRFKIAMIFVIVSPFVVNVLYITQVFNHLCKKYDMVLFDFSPVSYSVMFIIFAYVTTRYRIIELKPLMQYEVIDNVEEGILALDDKRDIVYFNQSAQEMLQGERLNKFTRLIKRLNFNRDFSVVETGELSLYVKCISRMSGDKRSTVMIIKDISSIVEVENRIRLRKVSIERKNQRLKDNIEIIKRNSRYKARKYMAGQLHDIMGHSLAVTIKLIETALIYIDKDRNLAREKIQFSVESLDEGIMAIRDIQAQVKGGRKEDGCTREDGSCKDEILSIFNVLDLAGVESRIYLRGDFSVISDEVAGEMKNICREIVTNILKHSGATKVFVNIFIENPIKDYKNEICVGSELCFRVMDNGCGIKELHKGNGLRNMEERVKNLNGSIKFSGEDGDGFLVTGKIVI